MMTAMRVSQHAIQMFHLRVHVTPQAASVLREEWERASNATRDQLGIFRVTPRDGATARVGKYGRCYFLMLAKNGTIVTVLV